MCESMAILRCERILECTQHVQFVSEHRSPKLGSLHQSSILCKGPDDGRKMIHCDKCMVPNQMFTVKAHAKMQMVTLT